MRRVLIRPHERETYVSWKAMIGRCKYSCVNGWKNYGGRGIKVCPRWLESFSNFVADMGLRPPGMQIGRKDNAGDYAPGNCEWQTRKQNALNTRRNLLVNCRGKMIPACQAAEECGHNYNNLCAFLYRHRGYSGDVSLIVFPPLRKLNDHAVRQIRESDISQSRTAKLFGVSKSLVRAVQKRQIWKHV